MEKNKYARFSTEQETKSILEYVSMEGKLNASGIPLMHDENGLYLETRGMHSLVIGATGSGKTQSISLPVIDTSLRSGDSILINDPLGEIYDRFASKFKKENYNIITINFKEPNYGDGWNPLTLPYNEYKNGNQDTALSLLEEIGYYLFVDKSELNNNSDPFWINTTIDFFVGICLYLFENAKEDEINLSSVANAARDMTNSSFKETLNNMPKTSAIYNYLAATVIAPVETRGSILAVFNQKIKQYIARIAISEMISESTFDITKVTEKTAIFIISDHNNTSNNLIPLFIKQIYYSINKYGTHDKYFNVLLDEFDSIVPIKDLSYLLSSSRAIKVRFILFIQSILNLNMLYGKENTELLKISVGNIIYLFANDLETLNTISSYCGNESNNTPLITVEELKTLKAFESIVLIPRMMPIKTKLLPFYKYEQESLEKMELVKRETKGIKIYSMYE